MMRSLRARVSPCFILMRFLSKHFMAYLGAKCPCRVLPPPTATATALPTALPSHPPTHSRVTAPGCHPQP